MHAQREFYQRDDTILEQTAKIKQLESSAQQREETILMQAADIEQIKFSAQQREEAILMQAADIEQIKFSAAQKIELQFEQHELKLNECIDTIKKLPDEVKGLGIILDDTKKNSFKK